MARATFTIRRNGKKVGTASFIGKSWKAARATGARVLSALSRKKKSNPKPKVRHAKRRAMAKPRRKKNLNFGQRMARARKAKARKRR